MAKSAYSAQEKYEIIVAYENRQTSARHFLRQYNISKGTINKWIYLFQTYGMEGEEAGIVTLLLSTYNHKDEKVLEAEVSALIKV